MSGCFSHAKFGECCQRKLSTGIQNWSETKFLFTFTNRNDYMFFSQITLYSRDTSEKKLSRTGDLKVHEFNYPSHCCSTAWDRL